MSRSTAMRTVPGVGLGLFAWLAVATLGNLLLRQFLPGYREVEASMNFTFPMQVGRLLLAVASSAACGWVAARIAGDAVRAPLISGLILLVFFVPVHLSMWARFPLWYHLVFFISLPVVPPLAARLRSRSSVE